jgi:hypothetical protein
MDLKKTRDLDIAKEKFNLSSEIINCIDYDKWVEHIDNNNDVFTWFEQTKDGKKIIEKLDTIPDDFKNSFLSLLNKVRCFTAYNFKKNIYEISVGYSKASEKISISFERPPSLEDLKIFLEMAKHLDALLLKDGKEIIDEKVIEELEKIK